jgi:hypothetical protein
LLAFIVAAYVLDEWREWYASGQLRSERVSLNEELIRHSLVWWYENGQKKIEANSSNDKAMGGSGPKYAKRGWGGESWDPQGNPKGGSLIKTKCDSMPKFKPLRRSELERPELYQGRQSN